MQNPGVIRGSHCSSYISFALLLLVLARLIMSCAVLFAVFNVLSGMPTDVIPDGITVWWVVPAFLSVLLPLCVVVLIVAHPEKGFRVCLKGMSE